MTKRFFPVLLLLCCSRSGFSDQTLLVIEAEQAQLVESQALNTGGVECAVLGKKEAKITATFSLERKVKASVWIRLNFPWGGNDAVSVAIDGAEPLKVTAKNDRSGRWDNGNFQVWHWARAGEAELDKGQHTLTIAAAAGAGERVDKIVLYEGQEPWREAWLTGDLARLYGRETRFSLTETEPLVVESENFDHLEAQIVRELDALTFARIAQDGARIAFLFQSKKPVRARICLRQLFEAKNMFEGYTMEEMAENCYVELDGELIWTFFEQDGRRWHWRRAGIGPVDIPAGKHLLSITKQGSPVRIDKVAILPEGAGAKSADVLKPGPHVLPFGLANSVPSETAKRVSDWSLFGSLAEKTDGQFLGEADGGVQLPLKLDLPQGKGLLVLEKLKPLVSCEARACRNREQRIAVPVRSGAGVRLFVVYEDREGERFLGELVRQPASDQWGTAAHIIPLDCLDARGTYFDGTGELTSGSLARPFYGAPGEKSGPQVSNEGFAANRKVDYPLAVTHLVLEKTENRKETLFLGEPAFDSPFSVSAAISGKTDPDDARTDVSVRLTLRNDGTVPATVPVCFRVEELDHDFHYELASRRVLARRTLTVVANQSVSLDVKLALGKTEVRRFLYAAGQGDFRTLLVGGSAADAKVQAAMSELEQRHGAFRLGPLKRKDGKPVLRSEVSALCGRPDGFTILLDGLDVTSRQYADREDYASRLDARGYDLSDEAGWPRIYVPYGVVAVDPEVGRVKFAEGDRDPLSVVGRSDIGFAVPGHGEPVIRGNYAVVPPGEGNHTLVDISDKKNPKPISYLPSWYFSRSFYPFRGRAYVESSHRGLMMVDGNLDNPYRLGSLRSVDFSREQYGRFIHIFEKEAVAVSAGGSALWFHDLSDPYLPREVAKVDGVGGFSLVPSADLAFVSTATEVKAVDVSDPRKPRLLDGALPRPKTPPVKDQKEVVASLATVGDDWLALRLGPKFLLSRWKAKRQAIAFEAGPEIEVPKGCGHLLSAFHKGYFYILDGKGGPGQYGIGWGGPKSRWFVYDLKQAAAEPSYSWEDPQPTAYGAISLSGDYAYVNDYNYGLWIFDLSNPAKPVKIGGAATGGEGDACWTNGRTVYAWQTFGGHLFAIDVTNPERPTRRGTYWDGAWVNYDNRFRGSYTVSGAGDCVYLSKSGRGLQAVDYTDPASPKEAAVFQDKDGKPIMVGGACVHAVDARAYVVRGQPKGPELLIYDVSEPAKPKLVSTSDVPVGTTLFKKGDILYLAGGKVLCMVGVAGDKPQILSTLDINQHTKDGQMIGGIAVTRGHAYLTSWQEAPVTRLYVVDVRDPQKPGFVGLIDPSPDYMDAPCSSSWGDFYQDIVSDGDYIFVGDYAQSECFDVSDPARPRFFGRKPLGYQWSCGQKRGEYLFVPGLATMTVLDVPTSSQVPKGKVTVR